MNIKSLLLGIVVAIGFSPLLTSCHSTSSQTSSIALDSIVDSYADTLRTDSGEHVFLQTLHYVYPEGNDSLLMSFNKILFEGDSLVLTNPQEVAAHFRQSLHTNHIEALGVDEMDSLENEGEVFIPYGPFELHLSSSVPYSDRTILSGIAQNSGYTGGAHGYESFRYFSLLMNGTIVREQDIFIENFQDKLGDLILRQIMKDYKVSSPQQLLDEQGFFGSDIKPNNNFYLTNEGIYYCYVAYEIASYATGAVKVFIPYDSLRELLKPETFVWKYLN